MESLSRRLRKKCGYNAYMCVRDLFLTDQPACTTGCAEGNSFKKALSGAQLDIVLLKTNICKNIL